MEYSYQTIIKQSALYSPTFALNRIKSKSERRTSKRGMILILEALEAARAGIYQAGSMLIPAKYKPFSKQPSAGRNTRMEGVV